jgi:glycosyltransferase involved in cell wall biosynthesis
VRNVEIVSLLGEYNSPIHWFLYFYKLFQYSKNFLRKHNVDLVHHFRPCYRGFDSINVLALTGLLKETSFVAGPAEIPHVFTQDDYIGIMRKSSPMINIEYLALQRLNNAFMVPLWRELFVSSFSECDAFIVAYEAARKLYSKLISRKKIVVIPYGVDLNTFKFSTPPKNYDILFVGNLIGRKGLDYLIRAMSKVKKEFPDAKLHIVGDGPQRIRLEALSERLRLQRNVIFHGRVNKDGLLHSYKNCRVFCHPSLSEGFCHTILEAMASGRPVVSTKTFGSCMVEDGKTGFLVPIRDVDSLAEKILDLLNDYELTVKMALNAREKVEKEYDLVKMIEKYYKLYESIVY